MHNNQYITYTKKNGRAYIIALNKDNGQEIWAWSDIFTPQEEAKTQQVHVFDNVLVWRSVRRVYAINLLTGKTVWRENIMNNTGFGGDYLTGLGNRFLFPSSNVIYFNGFTRTGNINTNPILMPGGDVRRVISSAPRMFLNEAPNLVLQANLKDTIAILAHTTAEGEGANVFTMYNLTQDKIMYTKIIPGDTSGAFGGYPPSVHNGRIYWPSGSFVLCFDIKTGNELWRTRFGSIFDYSGLVITTLANHHQSLITIGFAGERIC